MAQGGAVHFAVSENGTLVYATSYGSTAVPRTLTWVDRQGREDPIGAPPRPYLYPRLSPDGYADRVGCQRAEQRHLDLGSDTEGGDAPHNRSRSRPLANLDA